MSRLVVGPFNRVEGDLEIKLDVENGAVAAAYINSPLYRGFEQILLGKAPADALVYAPRICGICSVSQSVAAATALAKAQGLTPPENGARLQNLILAAENVADHLTHFYMFFMPDFAQSLYAGEPWFEAAARFRAMGGPAQREFIPARAALLHIMGLVAGHWPHTLGLQPGGTTRAIGRAVQARLTGIVLGMRRFLEATLFGDALESVAALSNGAALNEWAEASGPGASDFGRFLAISEALGLGAIGRATDVFLSYGAYAVNDAPAFARGVYSSGTVSGLDPAAITEDHSSSWLVRPEAASPPARGLTVPDADAPGAYSWCKAPRLGGAVVETGALARQLVDGHPLLRDLAASAGGNVQQPRDRPADRGGAAHSAHGAVDLGNQARRALLRARSDAGRSEGRWASRSRARLARPLARNPEGAHFQLPDRGANHLELLAARWRRAAWSLRAGARWRGRQSGRNRAGRRAAHRAVFRPMHGVHGALARAQDRRDKLRLRLHNDRPSIGLLA